MYFDNELERRRKLCLENYNDLKKSITKIDENGKLNGFLLALEHMKDMENQLKEQQDKLNKYTSFFNMLNSLLPNNTFL